MDFSKMVNEHLDRGAEVTVAAKPVPTEEASSLGLLSIGEDAKITELDLDKRRIKLSVKAAQIDEEKSLVAKFGEGATKSGATLKGIFEKALGRKSTKKKDK